MITSKDLEELQKARDAATRHWLHMCQMHDDRMATSAQVKAAREAANRAESAYNRAVWQLQEQQLNARPAR